MRGDLINVYQYLNHRWQVDGVRPFSVVISIRTRGNEYKLEHRKFHTSTRNNFFTLTVSEPWSKLPKKTAKSPSLEILKTPLDVFQHYLM